ncbi:MAG: C/D box methylation guide ribonucleoprotein complex aNOP56 subunit [Thermoprotei archaeon]|nr:MAG: C/D box methylation guide ribonucleoprotein complex aNOP56 subunit [Thermoprotei archaeon]
MKMKAYILPVCCGLLAVDEESNLISYKLWNDDVAASKLSMLEDGQVVEELESLVKEVSERGFKEIVLEHEELASNLSRKIDEVAVSVEPGSEVFQKIRKHLPALLERIGINPKEYRSKLYNISLALTRQKVKKAAEKRDLFVAQAINAIDDINKTINLFASRLREWYGLHFPELNNIVEDHEDYIKIISEIGLRSNMNIEALKNIGFDDDEARKIVSAAERSMGAEFTEFDLDAIRSLSDTTLALYGVRRKLEKYIDEAMKEVAPNIRGLVGPLLGARLISLAGGLNKLATLPASTIQVLGAEKALFRALRTGGKPPKHGVIFQHPAIHKSPRWQRGKIARALAAKLAIAARIDAFTGEYKADILKEELEKRIEEIKTLYAKPPARKPREEKRKEKRRRFKGKRKDRGKRHRR